MSQETYPQHYVCTHQQERELVAQHQRFWLGTCGCRAGGAGCKRSGAEVCLTFNASSQGSYPHRYEATRKEVLDVLLTAERQHLVSRPFRDMTNKQVIEGICHCCDDCCSYFLNPGEVCDRGNLVESTNLEVCTDCGVCVELCYFGARLLTNGKLAFQREACYGCGVCAEACPEEAISMISRADTE
jgi:ferredoxin